MNAKIKDEQLGLLIDLQEIVQEIQKLKQLKEKIPKEIEHEHQVFEKISDEIKQIEEKIKENQKEQRSKEIETRSAKDRLIVSKEKLPSVKTNKEYSALLHEIENLNSKIDRQEDIELELMESIEENQKECKKKLKEKDAEEKKFLDVKERKGEELEKLNEVLEEELNQENELAGKVETKWLKHYRNLVGSRKGSVVVAIDKETCGGCYQSLMPQLSIEVRQNDSIITCPYCSRFLFAKNATGVD